MALPSIPSSAYQAVAFNPQGNGGNLPLLIQVGAAGGLTPTQAFLITLGGVPVDLTTADFLQMVITRQGDPPYGDAEDSIWKAMANDISSTDGVAVFGANLVPLTPFTVYDYYILLSIGRVVHVIGITSPGKYAIVRA